MIGPHYDLGPLLARSEQLPCPDDSEAFALVLTVVPLFRVEGSPEIPDRVETPYSFIVADDYFCLKQCATHLRVAGVRVDGELAVPVG